MLSLLKQSLSSLTNVAGSLKLRPPQPPRSIYFDEQLNTAFAKDGFTIVDLISQDEVLDLTRKIRGLSDAVDPSDVHLNTAYKISAFHNDESYKRALFDQLYTCLKPRVDAVLDNYVPLVLNVIEKEPSQPNNFVQIHQNPSFAEEPAYRSVSVWIPLIDANKRNGTVGVVPGSHNVFDRMRAPNMPALFGTFADKLKEHYFQPLSVAAGQSLILDDGLVHWSYPNLSETRRTAIQLILVPAESKHVYYHYNTAGRHPRLDVYEVNKDFFFCFNCMQKPAGLKLLKSVRYQYQPCSEKEFVRRVSVNNPDIAKSTQLLSVTP